jgi:hypothetical protein
MARTYLDDERKIRALHDIQADMEQDARTLDGQLFNATVIGTQLGNLMAAISALAGVMLSDLEAD